MTIPALTDLGEGVHRLRLREWYDVQSKHPRYRVGERPWFRGFVFEVLESKSSVASVLVTHVESAPPWFRVDGTPALVGEDYVGVVRRTQSGRLVSEIHVAPTLVLRVEGEGRDAVD